jgi:hypothetical protein
MKRAVLLLTLALVGCGPPQKPFGWYKTDGTVPSQEFFDLQHAICHGEVSKASLASPEPDALGFAIQQSRLRDDAYAGCMIQHGLVLREIH